MNFSQSVVSYQSKTFVCVCNLGAFADNLADALDRLLIIMYDDKGLQVGFGVTQFICTAQNCIMITASLNTRKMTPGLYCQSDTHITLAVSK